MSKTTSLSQNFSRYANNIVYLDTKGSTLVGDSQPVGSVTVKQTIDGVFTPSVQAALDDIVSLYTLPINSVVVNTDGVSPQSIQQVDSFAFSGSVVYDGLTAGAPVKFNFLGFYIDVEVGDSADEVASKTKIYLDTVVGSGSVFNSVNFGASLNILQIQYNDVQTHNIDEIVNIGITATPTTISPAKGGYGVWEKIGTESKDLDGSTTTDPTIFYYFKRVY